MVSRFMQSTWLWASVVIGGMVLAALLFLGGQTSMVLSTVGSSVGGDSGQVVGTGVGPDTAGTDTTGTGAQGGQTVAIVLDAARADLLVVKTGTISIQVRDVPAALTTAATRIGALGGFVAGSQQTGEGDAVSASVTYRVPAEHWEDALAAVRSIGLKVIDEKTATEDVTGKVVDLGARIANLRATEAALQGIMGKATKIADVLAVQSELTKVRGDIEQATAEKQHLSEQAALSTLTVDFGLQPRPAVVVSQRKFDPQTQVDRATATLVDILQGLATAGIWFAIVWLPILLVLGLVGIVAIYVYRRAQRRGGARGGLGPPPAPVDVPPALAG
jgi:hypothetical protein